MKYVALGLLLVSCGQPASNISRTSDCPVREVITIQAPVEVPETEVEEPKLIHEGSLCNSTVVSLGESFYAVYGNMLLPLNKEKTRIRTMRINNINYTCSISVSKSGDLKETFKKVN